VTFAFKSLCHLAFHVVLTGLLSRRNYKEVVYEIEKFIFKSSPDKRIAGIYVIDAVVRGFEKIKQDEGNVFAAR
jgi:hypothetical protein